MIRFTSRTDTPATTAVSVAVKTSIWVVIDVFSSNNCNPSDASEAIYAESFLLQPFPASITTSRDCSEIGRNNVQSQPNRLSWTAASVVVGQSDSFVRFSITVVGSTIWIPFPTGNS